MCHFSSFLLSTGGQIDCRMSSVTGQREGDGCGRKACDGAWATSPPSRFGLVHQTSLRALSSILRPSRQPARRRGCCHRSYRSCGMSASDRGICPSEPGHQSVPSRLGATRTVCCQLAMIFTSKCLGEQHKTAPLDWCLALNWKNWSTNIG